MTGGRRALAQEALDFVGRGREAGEVEVEAAEEDFGRSIGGRLQAFLR